MPGSVYTIDDSQTLPVHARQRQFAKDQRAAYKGLRSDLSGFGKVAAGAFGKIGPESGSAAAGVTKLDAALDPLLKELRLIREATEAAGKGLGGVGGAAKPAAEKLEFLARRLEVVNRLARESSVSTKTARAVVGAYGKELDRVGKDAAAYAVRIDKAENETLSLVAAQRRAVKEAAAMAAAERKAASAVADAAGELALLAKRQEVTARLMRENGVSAKAAGAAARVYGKDIGKLGAEAAQLAKRLDTAQKETDQLRDAQRRASSTVSKGAGLVGTMTTRLVAMAVAYGGVRLAIAAVKAPSAAFGDVQTSLVAVSKTTDIVGDDLDALSATVTGFATGPVPILKTALLSIGAAAGQIGIEGRENIEEQIFLFGKLSAAVDEIDPADAVREMAVLRNVQGESVESTEAQVNVLVRLGNELATGEARILAHASEVGRATSQFRIGSVETLAFAGALASMGAKAEGAGTAIGRSMREMQSAVSEGGGALDEFARIAQVSSDEFVKQWTEDPVKAFDTFLEGLATFGRDAGQELAKVGLGSDRLAKVLPVLATNLDVLRDSQARARDEAQILTAVNKEAAAAFDTQNKDVDRLTNTLLAQAEAIGGDVSPALRAAAADWANFIGSADANQIGTVIGGALTIASKAVLLLAENVDILVAGFAVFALLKVPASIITLPVIVAAIETAVASLTTFLAANPLLAPFVVATAAVLALNAAINAWSANSQKQISAITSESDRLRGAITSIQDALRSGDTAQLESSLATTGEGIEDLTGQAEELRAKLATVFQESATLGEGLAAQAKLKEELASVERQVVALTVGELKLNEALETSTDLTEEARKKAQALAKATSDQTKARKAAAVAEEEFVKLQKEAARITASNLSVSGKAFAELLQAQELVVAGAFDAADGQKALKIALVDFQGASRRAADEERKLGQERAASIVKVAILTGDAERVTVEALAATNRYGLAIQQLPVGPVKDVAETFKDVSVETERAARVQEEARRTVLAATGELLREEEMRLAVEREIAALTASGEITSDTAEQLRLHTGIRDRAEETTDAFSATAGAISSLLGELDSDIGEFVDSILGVVDALTGVGTGGGQGGIGGLIGGQGGQGQGQGGGVLGAVGPLVSQGGGAGTAAAAASTFASAVPILGAFAAVFSAVDAIVKKKEMEKFAGSIGFAADEAGRFNETRFLEASAGKGQKGGLLSSANIEAERLFDAMVDGLDKLRLAGGLLIDKLPAIAIRMRNDGKAVELSLAGAVVGIFDTAEQAIAAGLSLQLSKGDFSGIGDTVAAVLSRATQEVDIDALAESLDFARMIDEAGLTKAARAIEVVQIQFSIMREKLMEFFEVGAGFGPAMEKLIILRNEELEVIKKGITDVLGGFIPGFDNSISTLIDAAAEAEAFAAALDTETAARERELVAIEKAANAQEQRTFVESTPVSGEGAGVGGQGPIGEGAGGSGIDQQVDEAIQDLGALGGALGDLGEDVSETGRGLLNLGDIAAGMAGEVGGAAEGLGEEISVGLSAGLRQTVDSAGNIVDDAAARIAAGMEDLSDTATAVEADMALVEEALMDIPDAIDPALIKRAVDGAASGLASSLAGLTQSVFGTQLDNASLQKFAALDAQAALIQQLQSARELLAVEGLLEGASRAAFEAVVNNAQAALDELLAGGALSGARGGGGGRQQAREDVLGFFADLAQAASGTSSGMIALTDSLAEFRDAQQEAARLGKVGAEVIEQAFRDFLTVSAEAAVEGVRGFIDAASGAGEFELALRDQTAQFADARDQLTLLIQLAEQQGESTAALIDQRRELVEAEQLAAQQLVATNLVDELAALGVGLDPEVLEKMAEAEFRLAQARAINSLAAAAELGLLEGVDIAGLIMDINDATRPDILAAEAEEASEMTDALDEATRATERITGIFDGLRQEAGPAGEGLLSLRGRLQDFRADVREAVGLGTFSAGEISDAWQDFLSVSADVATRGVQGFLDAANGVGIFEAALRDQTAQFAEADQQLRLLIRAGRQEGQAVDDLITQRQDLARAEELAAKQLAGAALVSELDALGVALDPDVLREMREGELALMKARSISSVAAAAEAGLLTGGIDEIISQINAVTLDDLSGVDQAGRFETLEDLFGSFADGLEVSILSIGERFDALTENATGLNASQEQLLDLRRRETAELSALADESLRTVQAETAAADGLGPFSDQMLDLSSRFDTVRGELALVIAAVRDAGGSTAELDAQMSNLDRSERVAARGIAVGLVGSLAQLGIALPVDITQRLAQAQFLLAQAEILAALATEEFRMALAQVGVDAGHIIQLVLAGPTTAGATGTPGSARGGSSGGGGTAPGEDLAALAAQVRETLEGFNRSDLGATASAAADLAQRFKDVREDASRAGVPIEEVAAAIGKARDAFISSSLDAIGPPPDFSATVSELDVLEETFVDVFAALLIAGGGVDDMADAAERLKFNAGQLEAALDAPLDAIIQRLRRDAPDSTNRAVFLESQEAFGDLVATALDQTATEAERVAAVEALADASGDFEQQIMDFLGAGPGAQAALDEMLRALEAVKDEDIIVLTQLDVLKAQAAALAEIELANKAMPTQTQQSSSFSTLGSSVDAIPGALESLIDPILLEELIAAFDAADLDLGVAALSELIILIGTVPFAELTTALADAGVNVADTIAGLTAELGVGGFADLVAELGAVPFASVIASLDAAGVDIVALATELGADQFSALATALTIFDPALIADFGIDALADLTTAVSNSTLDFSTLSFSEIVDELGPLGGIATAIGEEDFRQITEALSPVARDLVTTAAETTATATEAANTAVAVTLDTGAIPNKLTSVRNALGAGGADLNRHTLDTFGAIGTGKGGGSLQGIMSDIAGALGVAGFAEGGIVPFDMLAQVHKNELVVPAERVESLLAGSLGTTFELPAFAPPLPDLPAFGGGFDSGSRDRELLASLASLERAVRRLEKKNDTLTAEARQNAAVIARQVADGNTIARGTRAASAETAENTRRKSKGSGGGE